jgi:Holliday junction resolvasome RuvABC endonuclease subunit
MQKPTHYTIGISLGTRSTGLAIIKNDSLVYWKTISFKQPWSNKKMQTILTKLTQYIDNHSLNVIGIKIPTRPYCSAELLKLSTGFQAVLTAKQRPYRMLTIHDLKKHCFAHEKRNKKALVEMIGNKYPELYLKYQKECTNKNVHYTKLFEAIIAAEIVHENVIW